MLQIACKEADIRAANTGTPVEPVVGLINAWTGTGKSTVVRTLAMRAAETLAASEPDGTVFIGVPHHRLSDEQVKDLAKNFPEKSDIGIAVWRGMTADDPDTPGAKMCLRPTEVQAALRAGVESLCSRRVKDKATGKWATVQCPLFEQCGYQRQKLRKARICIGAHEMLVHRLPAALGDVRRIFLDEDFSDAFTFGTEKPVDLPLSVFKEDCKSKELAREHADLVTALAHSPHGALVRSALPSKFTADLCRQMSKLEWNEKTDQEILPSMTGEVLAKALEKIGDKNFNVRWRATFWKMLAEFLEGEHEKCGRISLVARRGQLSIQMRGLRDLREGWSKAHVLLTDATADIEIVRTIWPQAVEHKYSGGRLPTPHVTLRQIIDTPISKAVFSPKESAADASDPDQSSDRDVRRARKARDLYAAVLARAVRQRMQLPDKPVGLITYKGAEEWIRANCPVPDWLFITHFGEVSGVNKFGGVSLLVVAGRPLPPSEAATRIAEALWGEAIEMQDYGSVETMIDATPDYAGRDTIKGTQWRHPDARVERVRRHVCEGALLQAIGRARGILRTADNPVVIELWTDVPLAELGPVEPQVWGHIAPTLDAVMLATHGVVMSNTVHAANLAPRSWGLVRLSRRLVRGRCGTFLY